MPWLLVAFAVCVFAAPTRGQMFGGVETAHAEGFDTDPSCPEYVVIYGMQGFQSDAAWGANNEINVVDPSTFASCLSGDTTRAATGHTSRLHLGADSNNWVEAGWMVKNASSQCSNYTGLGHCFSIFTEWGLDGTKAQPTALWNPASPSPGGYLPPSCVTGGNWERFDVEVTDPLSLPGYWSLAVDCEDGVGYRALTTYNTGYSTGVAEAEAFERGVTTMEGTVHRDLHFYDQHSHYTLSSGLVCRHDGDLYWDASLPSGSEMDLVLGNTVCGSITN